ncbi:MAG: hypothetical protein KF841_09430 [Phycisphaerae bacterium]|nr:hypothetical protein [Phycisphaerae bacterium]
MIHTMDAQDKIEKRIASLIALHFDPQDGTPYWIERSKQLSFDPRDAIHQLNDLHRLGFMDQNALRSRPLADFVPRSIWERRNDLIIAQTGGTLGEPVWTAYTPEEYESAFVAPFVAAADHVCFPRGGTWLYVGPSGPHIIGRAARSIALATGAREPFTVDFDSRWARKLPSGSFAADRYLIHVVEQALAIVRTQPITHLFTTPPVLAALGDQMSQSERTRIIGIHYGGLSLTPGQLQRLQEQVFPDAVHLSGYGNTLFGCCLELNVHRGRDLRYFPWGERIVFGTCPDENDAASIDYAMHDVRGRCIFTRLAETVLLVNMLERDEVAITPPPDDAPAGFTLSGVIAPTPRQQVTAATAASLY